MKIIKENNNILMVLKEIDPIENTLKANDVDASFEKHIPNINRVGDKVEVVVNHVMEDDHYIEWILIDYNDKQVIKHFKPHEEPKVIVDYKEGMVAYSYCNKHSLWVNDKIG